MSLINDALKRASQSSKHNPHNRGGDPVSPLQAVVGGRPKRFQINFAVLAVPALVLLVLGGSTWGFLSWRGKPKAAQKEPVPSKQAEKSGTAPSAATQPPRASTATNQTTHTEPAQAVAQTPRSTEAPSPSKPPKAAPSTKPQTAPPAQTASAKTQKPATADPVQSAPTPRAAPPKVAPDPKPSTPAVEKAFPPVKLQGIAFRIKNPSVLLNGKVLELGDELDGLTVKKIERSSVTLEFGGQTKVFPLK